VNNIASAGQNLPGGDDGTSLLLGLGGRYKFTDMVSVRAEWEYIDDVFDEEVHLYSLGLELHFGN
jgi:opacity protein-like surface antigen